MKHQWRVCRLTAALVVAVLPVVVVEILHPVVGLLGDDHGYDDVRSRTIHASYPPFGSRSRRINSSNSSIPKIILDTDPAGLIWTGLDVDDDLAILNALSLHQAHVIQLLGITVTGGNAPIQYTYPNAIDLVRYKAGISKENMGVYRGGGTPLTREVRHEREQSPTILNAMIASEATNYLIDTIMNAEEKSITVLCIGPMTNIAAAFLLEPRIDDRIERIVSMGGTLTPGLPIDLNVRTDPVSASIVWNDMNCTKIIIPVETCVQAVFGAAQLTKVEGQCSKGAAIRGRIQPIICSYLTRLRLQRQIMPWAVNRRFIGRGGLRKISRHAFDGFVLWDLVALWAVVRPDLFEHWTYYEAMLLPYESTDILSRYKGQTRHGSEDDGNESKNTNRVLVPLTLTNEQDLYDLILDHLWLPNLSLDSHQDSQLSFRDQLGCLPDWLSLVLVTGLGLLFLLRLR